MDRMKLWPHGALIILAGAIIAAVAALLFTRYERTASAKEAPLAARVERVDGQVGLNRSLDQSQNAQWVEATANTPISVGDRVITRDNSRTDIAFTGRNFATLQANTSLDVLELSNQKNQLALRQGSALFDVGSLPSGELFEVATPCGAVDMKQAGLYQVAIDDQGNAVANTLNGLAEVVGQSGTGEIQKGESLTLSCQSGQGAVLSRIDKGQAGALVDSYYRYRYPKKYDGRYINYDTYLGDPYYYDPYNRDISYHYVSEYIPGVEDLDDYGNWQYVNNYGYGWHPYAETAWAPYQSGYWGMDYPFGLTWVSNEPWGYAPYHYGRWTYASNEWFWIPDTVSTYPAYSPALVAFIPVSQSTVAWVALGPGDPYTPFYYDPNWQPVYLNSTPVIQERIVNLNVPGAVNVVQVKDFTRGIDPRVITTIDPQTVARVRPVLDPMSVDPLRRAAFETRQAQRRFDVPPAIGQRINTPVVASAAPLAAMNRRDLARAMRVEPVPSNLRNQKLQLRDERAANVGARQPTTNGGASIAEQQARERQMAELTTRASRGDRTAREQLRGLQRQQVEAQRAERVTGQQAQGEQVRQQMQTRAQAMAAGQQQQLQQAGIRRQQQAQREATRQQAITNRQQPRVTQQPNDQGERAGNRVQRAPQNIPRAQPEMRRLPQPQAQPRPQPQRTRPPSYQPQQMPQRVIRQPQQPRMVRPQEPPRAQPQPQRVPAPQARPPSQPRAERPQVQAQPRPQPAPRVEQKQGPPATAPSGPPAKKKPPA